VDEGAFARGPQEGLGGLGAGLEEIAEHGVVADLERHSGLGHGAGLEIGDDAAAVVAQAAGLFKLGPVAGRDEAAVAGQMRGFGDETLGQIDQQAAEFRRQGQPIEGGGDAGGRPGQRIPGRREQAGYAFCDRQAGADGGEIARSAAAEREARRSPCDVG
jgi:hypothetical protein